MVTQASEYGKLWSIFSGSGNQAEYCQGWLELQCARIPKAFSGVLLLRTDQNTSSTYTPVASWPADRQAIRSLIDLADWVIEERYGLVSELDADNAPGTDSQVLYGVAYPLKIDDEIAGVVAIAIGVHDPASLAYAEEQLQWGISWIELMVRRHQRDMSGSELPRLRSAVDILTSVLSDSSFEQSCMTFVTELATVFQCERVSFAVMRFGRAKVKAISHSAEFGKQMNLVKMLEAAMEEAVFQRSDILLPPRPENQLIIQDHLKLSESRGAEAVYTLPVFQDKKYTGVLTFERSSQQPFHDSELESIRSITALTAEALYLQQRNERPILQKLAEQGFEQFRRLFGAGYPGRKLALLSLMLVVAFFSIATDTYRVAGDSRLEGAVRQVVVAPFDGYIETADRRAGDHVSKDELLSRLDDRDLGLERLNWISERSKLNRQYEEALAAHERGNAKVIAAQLEQNKANLELVERQLQRTMLRSPFDGVITSGDLTQQIGSAVKQGDVLFEVAPLDRYRLIIWVDEHQIGEVSAGMSGHLVLKAMPDERFSFQVDRLTPISEAKDGGNYFRVEAMLENASGRLRPGMEGVAKIEIGERKLISILSRDLVRWFKIKTWAWLP